MIVWLTLFDSGEENERVLINIDTVTYIRRFSRFSSIAFIGGNTVRVQETLQTIDELIMQWKG